MYYPGFMDSQWATHCFKKLKSNLNWERRETAPRSEYWTNLYGQDYTYGRGAGMRTYQSQPTTHDIEKINDRICKAHGILMYEGCFLNMYHNGNDALGWHADDDLGIDHLRPIAVITLGHSRRIEWKEQTPGSHPQGQLLEHGSLFLMPAGFQQTHFHRIPRDPSASGTRISLTYRGLI